ncbi:MAG: hypothetical protein MH137_12765 [Flavobacteriales bacterium]|nr:hypothetical protein [Flavobacteriales bacterium]
MRKSLFTAVFVLSITFVLSSCSKENTYLNRISKTWKVNRFTQNGVDKTSDWNSLWVNYRLAFTKDKNFMENATVATIPVGRSGIWDFTNNYSSLVREYSDNGEIQIFQLVTLSNSKLVVKQTGSNVDEWELVPL